MITIKGRITVKIKRKRIWKDASANYSLSTEIVSYPQVLSFDKMTLPTFIQEAVADSVLVCFYSLKVNTLK